MKQKTFRQLMASGPKTALGTFLEIPAGEMAEIAAIAGFDFGIVDAEHGMLGTDRALALIRACDAGGLVTVYRVPRLNPHQIGQALDFGASAVMVPNITTPQEADRAVRSARYHPLGNRGVNPFVRGARYNAADEDKEYYGRCNREISVILQIEGVEGIRQLDAILEVAGLDGIFIGPFDLSQSLGIPGQVTDPLVQQAIGDIVTRAGRKNIAVGSFATSLDQALGYVRMGVRFVAYGTDTLIAQRACRDLVRAFAAHRS